MNQFLNQSIFLYIIESGTIELTSVKNTRTRTRIKQCVTELVVLISHGYSFRYFEYRVGNVTHRQTSKDDSISKSKEERLQWQDM